MARWIGFWTQNRKVLGSIPNSGHALQADVDAHYMY